MKRCEEFRIACLGDSLTKGNESLVTGAGGHSGLRFLGNYPRTLAAQLPSRTRLPDLDEGDACCTAAERPRSRGRVLCPTVRNFGRGGSTASDDGPLSYRRTPEWRAAMAWRPHVAILLLGTNDGRRDALWTQGRLHGRRSVQRGLAQLLNSLLRLPSRPAVALALPLPLRLHNATVHARVHELVVPALVTAANRVAAASAPGDERSRGRGATRAAQRGLYRASGQRRRRRSRRLRRGGEAPADLLSEAQRCHRCAAGSVVLWDTRGAVPADQPSLFVPDGIHPTAQGATMLADAVRASLARCLCFSNANYTL